MKCREKVEWRRHPHASAHILVAYESRSRHRNDSGASHNSIRRVRVTYNGGIEERELRRGQGPLSVPISEAHCDGTHTVRRGRNTQYRRRIHKPNANHYNSTDIHVTIGSVNVDVGGCMYMCVCVWVCVTVCERACVSEAVRACVMRACALFVCVCVSVMACVAE
jgi:hypothetical protein